SSRRKKTSKGWTNSKGTALASTRRRRPGLRRRHHRLRAAATTTPAPAAASAPALPRGWSGGGFLGRGRCLRLPGAALGGFLGGSRLDQPDGARAAHLELLDAAQPRDEPRRARRAPEAARLEGVRERIDADRALGRAGEQLARHGEELVVWRRVGLARGLAAVRRRRDGARRRGRRSLSPPAPTAMRRSLQSRTPTDGALCTRCAPRSARRRAVSWFTTRQLPTATRSVVRVMRSTSRWASTRATWSARLEFSTSKKIPRRTDGCGRSGSGGGTRAAKSGSGLEVATGSASAASAGGGAPGSSSGRASGASAAARLLPPRRCRAGFLPVVTARTIANADDAGDRSATRMAPFRRFPARQARQSARAIPTAQPILTPVDGHSTFRA